MPNPLSTDIWLREAEGGCLDLTRSEIWWTDPFPKVRDRLHPALGMLRAVDPKHGNQDFYITHPGGCAWEMMRRPGVCRTPESRSRLWQGFREMAQGIAAPVDHLRDLLAEGNPDALRALSVPLRYEPMLQWEEFLPQWKEPATVIEDDPVRWLSDVRCVLSCWPGPLTLVLNQRCLYSLIDPSHTKWLDALRSLLSAPIPTLVGLEVDLPGLDFTDLEVGHLATLRHLSLRSVTGVSDLLAMCSNLENLRVRNISELVSLPAARCVDTDIATTSRLPFRMEQLYLRGNDIARAISLLDPVAQVRRLALDLEYMNWLFHPEDLANALQHLDVEELAITMPWSLDTMEGGGDEAWQKCLRALSSLPTLRTLRLPWDTASGPEDMEQAITASLGDVTWDRQSLLWPRSEGPVWAGWW